MFLHYFENRRKTYNKLKKDVILDANLINELPETDYISSNENGYFFKRAGKEIKWCIEAKDFIDFIKLVLNKRDLYWWERTGCNNKYI